MTEQELDRIMRRVLIDSLKTDDEKDEKDQDTSFEPTRRYKRKMRAMLSDPLNWLHRQEHPHWKRIARRVAIILITCIVAIGGVLTISSTARATVVCWFIEVYGNIIDYLYTGEQNPESLPQYEIFDLPKGYVKTACDIAPTLIAVTYENDEGDIIYFDYGFMHQGSQTDFILNDDDVFDVQINGMYGKFFRANIPGNLSEVTWIDSEQNIQFTIGACVEYDVLLHMAETVFLCKTTN